jgi:hypothetical protein
MRVLVLWDSARGVPPGEDAAWARGHAQTVGACAGVDGMALHPVATAAALHPSPCSWCLELRLAEGHAPRDVLRADAVAEFLGDLRLMGMRPRVLAIEGDQP